MKVNNKSVEEIANVLKNARRIAIFCHIRPDGDALGSALALCTALNNDGKEAYVLCEDEPPKKLRFLPHMDTVLKNLNKPLKTFDTLVSVDCADLSRMGVLFSSWYARFSGVTVNIDHHISNTGYGKNNYVFDCTATCEILPEVLDAAGFEITEDIATLMMAGLLTDSGNFSHKDVSSKTFNVAARLRGCGADVNYLNYNLFKHQPKNRAVLFAKVISKLRFFSADRIVIMTITCDDLKSVGAESSITEGMVDFPLSIEGVEFVASVMEVRERQYKISLRSNGKVDVNAIASQFGGGGHILASGCMIFADYEEVVERLVFFANQQL